MTPYGSSPRTIGKLTRNEHSGKKSCHNNPAVGTFKEHNFKNSLVN